MALKKPEKLRKFFLLLCGHPDIPYLPLTADTEDHVYTQFSFNWPIFWSYPRLGRSPKSKLLVTVVTLEMISD